MKTNGNVPDRIKLTLLNSSSGSIVEWYFKYDSTSASISRPFDSAAAFNIGTESNSPGVSPKPMNDLEISGFFQDWVIYDYMFQLTINQLLCVFGKYHHQ